MRTATLHIKVQPQWAENLKQIAKKREVSVGALIREAVTSCYQTELSGLPEAQRRALEAYRGGFISLGKLSGIMGMQVLTLRNWLLEHNIPQNNSFTEDDVRNA